MQRIYQRIETILAFESLHCESFRFETFQNGYIEYLQVMGKVIAKAICLNPACGKTFSGNENKKFCSSECKNEYHNARRKEENKEIGMVVNILKTNRRILEQLLGERKVKNVSGQRLLDNGFVFRYHTHRRPNKGDGKEYIFCFDLGYLPLENGWYKIVKGFKETE